MNPISKYKIEDMDFDDDEENMNENVLSNMNLTEASKPQVSSQEPKVPEPQPQQMNLKETTLSNINNISNDQSITQNFEIPDDAQTNPQAPGYHHVQIIDEDVENFKRRLDIMVKNFRTDSLNHFMSIKRNLLFEQKSIIESERKKYDALLSSKSDIIEHLKDDLAKTTAALNSQITIKEKVTGVIHQQNAHKLKLKTMGSAFGVLLAYHNKKKFKKDKVKKIQGQHNFSLKMNAFISLKKNAQDSKVMRIVSAKEKECNDKINEMAQYYGKEIEDLRNRLAEANLVVEKTKAAKNMIQENLKKVLMRGVMAMNMEAMNVLDVNSLENPSQQQPQQSPIVNQSFQPTNINQSFQPNSNQSFQQNQLANSNNNDKDGISVSIGENMPVAKDSNWINASSVPIGMKNDMLSEEYNMEIGEDYYGASNDNKPYNITPTPAENIYRGNSTQGSYYDEMQRNLMSIKNEFSAIKNMEESFNSNSGSNYMMMQPTNPAVNFSTKGNNTNTFIANASTVSNTNIVNNMSNTQKPQPGIKKKPSAGPPQSTIKKNLPPKKNISSNTTTNNKKIGVKK